MLQLYEMRIYRKAIRDVLGMLDFLDNSIALKPKEKNLLIKALITEAHNDVEHFSDTGGKIPFKYKYEKGKLVHFELMGK